MGKITDFIVLEYGEVIAFAIVMFSTIVVQQWTCNITEK